MIIDQALAALSAYSQHPDYTLRADFTIRKPSYFSCRTPEKEKIENVVKAYGQALIVVEIPWREKDLKILEGAYIGLGFLLDKSPKSPSRTNLLLAKTTLQRAIEAHPSTLT